MCRTCCTKSENVNLFPRVYYGRDQFLFYGFYPIKPNSFQFDALKTRYFSLQTSERNVLSCRFVKKIIKCFVNYADINNVVVPVMYGLFLNPDTVYAVGSLAKLNEPIFTKTIDWEKPVSGR